MVTSSRASLTQSIGARKALPTFRPMSQRHRACIPPLSVCGTGLVGAQEEKVCIGGRRHDAAAIAAGGHDGDALGLGGVGGAVNVGDGEIVEGVDHLVLHGGEKAGGVETISALLQAFLRDQAAPEHGAVEEVQRLFAGGGGVVDIVERRGGELHPEGAAIDDVGNPPLAGAASDGRAAGVEESGRGFGGARHLAST